MRNFLSVLGLSLLLLAGSARRASAGDAAWKRALFLSLERRVSFEFVETPLSEAVAFLQVLSGANMVLDPAAAGDGDPSINLKVDNMTMLNALTWICRLTELDFALQDGAIYIAPPEKMRHRTTLKIYDVSDLTMIIQDFPGPEFMLGGASPAGGGGVGALIAGVKEPPITAEDLADMIRRLIPAGGWGNQANVAVHGNKLIVSAPGAAGAAGAARDGRNGAAAAMARAKRKGPTYVAIDVRFVAVAESLLKKIEAQEERAEARAKMLISAIQKGKDARLAGAMTLTCKSGSNMRAMAGRIHGTQAVGDKRGSAFHGTRVDIHPVVSADGSSIAMAVNLRRADKNGKTSRSAAPVHEFTASMTCGLSDTVWLPGKKIRGRKNARPLIALITPTLTAAPPKAKPVALVPDGKKK